MPHDEEEIRKARLDGYLIGYINGVKAAMQIMQDGHDRTVSDLLADIDNNGIGREVPEFLKPRRHE